MAILRYKESFIGISNWVYELLELEDNPNLTHISLSGKVVPHDPKMLTREEAMKIIKEQGLVVVDRQETGETVWDTPDKEYQQRWKGQYLG